MSEANIAVKLKDNFTSGVNRMEDANKGFNTSMEDTQQKAKQYSQRLDDLIRQQSKLQTSLSSAKRDLQAAEKAFKATGDAADSDALEAAHEKYNRIKSELQDTTQAAKDTRRALYDLKETERKQGPSGSVTTSSGSILSQLGAAGATAMAGELASQAAGYFATSFGGDAVGGYVSSALSSAGMGAAIGSAIAPGIGTAIGAALGGLSGLLSGKFEQMEAMDDAYRDQVQELYSNLQQQQTERLGSGSSVAAQREQDAIAFNQLLGDGVGDQYLEDLRVLAASTPMEYSDLTGMSRALATGFGGDPERMLELMTAIGDAGSAVGIDAAGMTEMARSLSRMESSGKATLEYLNIFQDRGVDVIGMLSEGLGKTQEEIYDMISKSEIMGVDAVNIIQDAMTKMYDGAMEKQSQTFSGLASTLEDAQTELNNAMGEGYNEKRKQGMQEQIDFLSGETGESMQEAYRLMGEFQASLENQQEELQRNAIESVMSGVLSGAWSEDATAQLTDLMSQYDEAKAEDNGAEMGRVIAAAQAVAQAEYTNSEGYRTQVDANLQLVSDVQQAVAYSYYQAGYDLGQEMSKGVAAGLAAGSDGVVESLEPEDGSNSGRYAGLSVNGGVASTKKERVKNSGRYAGLSHAYGLERVPYDNYPALLHEGEQVLTAAEARSSGSGRSIQIGKLADQVVIREEADIDRFAAAFVRKLQDAMLTGVM